MALTADSLGELYKSADADTPVPVEVLESLRNVEIDLRQDGRTAARVFNECRPLPRRA